MSSIPVLGVLVLLLALALAGAEGKKRSEDLVRRSCVHASYPEVCLRSLAAYTGAAKSPQEVAKAAVSVSLKRAGRVREYLRGLAANVTGRERSAVGDCVEQVTDSVEELRNTLAELQHLSLGGDTFRWQMSNAETWVSAALTNEDTCLDGFQGTVRTDVKNKISNIAKVTSNALYMINRLDHTRPSSTLPHL